MSDVVLTLFDWFADDYESPIFMPQTGNLDSPKPKTDDKWKSPDDDVKDSWDKDITDDEDTSTGIEGFSSKESVVQEKKTEKMNKIVITEQKVAKHEEEKECEAQAAKNQKAIFAENDTAEQVLAELTDLIECVNCLDVPTQSSHIYQCVNGHLFCGLCLEKVKNCSVCQKPLNENSRNLMVEKFLAILKSYAAVKKEPSKSLEEPMKEIIEKDTTNQDVLTENLDTKSETEEWCTVVKKKKVKTKVSGEKKNVKNAKISGGGGKGPHQNMTQDDNNPGGTLKTIISNQMAGFLLRCGGSKLSKIRSKSGADIVISDPVQGSIERNLIIHGTLTQIQRAQILLQNEEEINEKGEETVKKIISNRECGRFLRNGGSILRKIENDTKASISVSPKGLDEEEDSERILTISGKPEQIQRAQFMLQQPELFKLAYEDDEEIIQITVSDKMAGGIIGINGTRVKKIMLDSNASVGFNMPVPGSNKRILTISGTKEEVQRAMCLLPPWTSVGNPQDWNCPPGAPPLLSKKKSLPRLAKQPKFI